MSNQFIPSQDGGGRAAFALVVGLLQTLADKGILTRGDAQAIVDKGLAIWESRATMAAAKEVINALRNVPIPKE